MHPRVDAYFDLHMGSLPLDFNVDVDSHDDSRYAVWLADFPACAAQGPTFLVAAKRLDAVAPGFLEEYAKAGGDFPMDPPDVTIMGFSSYSGAEEKQTMEVVAPELPPDRHKEFTSTPKAA
jgi:predicted RNase H-like HicB family nuclease